VLKADVLAAIEESRTALQDLLTEVRVLTRTPPAVHVPGSPVVYTEAELSMKMVITRFEEREIDGQRIKTSDVKAILYPIDGDVTLNDIIIFDNTSYRVLNNQPVMVGNQVGVHTLQLRTA
jgi:hypothetical protein